MNHTARSLNNTDLLSFFSIQNVLINVKLFCSLLFLLKVNVNSKIHYACVQKVMDLDNLVKCLPYYLWSGKFIQIRMFNLVEIKKKVLTRLGICSCKSVFTKNLNVLFYLATKEVKDLLLSQCLANSFNFSIVTPDLKIICFLFVCYFCF